MSNETPADVWAGSPARPATYQPCAWFDVRVPLRDGVTLSADITRPAVEGHYPAIVLRTPYNKNSMVAHTRARYFAAHGYAFVTLDVRGRGDSDGVFVPYRNDGIDGYDVIEWVAAQPW